jgi:y4mF family transcriptional regulator
MKQGSGSNPPSIVTGTIKPVAHCRDPHDSIGLYIRNRRRAAKLRQRELAELADVGIRFVSELESGKPTVRMDAVNKVLRVFGKKVSYVDIPPDQRATDA